MSAPDLSRRDSDETDAGLWTRARVISALMTARAELLDAIGGLTPREAEKPMGLGKWNVRETVLHVVVRDRARLAEMDAVVAGAPASWQGHGPEEYARLNASDLAGMRGHSFEQALALLDSTRRELQERLALVPEQPVAVWQPAHPFGWMMEALHQHDRHHAQQIRRWRAANGI